MCALAYEEDCLREAATELDRKITMVERQVHLASIRFFLLNTPVL